MINLYFDSHCTHININTSIILNYSVSGFKLNQLIYVALTLSCLLGHNELLLSQAEHQEQILRSFITASYG